MILAHISLSVAKIETEIETIYVNNNNLLTIINLTRKPTSFGALRQMTHNALPSSEGRGGAEGVRMCLLVASTPEPAVHGMHGSHGAHGSHEAKNETAQDCGADTSLTQTVHVLVGCGCQSQLCATPPAWRFDSAEMATAKASS